MLFNVAAIQMIGLNGPVYRGFFVRYLNKLHLSPRSVIVELVIQFPKKRKVI